MISWIRFSKIFIMAQRAHSVEKSNLHYPQSVWKIHFKTVMSVLQKYAKIFSDYLFKAFNNSLFCNTEIISSQRSDND